MLLALAAGSVVSLPLSGSLIERFRLTTGRGDDVGAARRRMVGVALGYLVGVVPVVVALFMFGFANGAWDVGMNVQGAAVERGLGWSIMSRFHAGWSLGTVAGALIGAAMVALGVPVTAHLIGAALVVALVVPLATRRLSPMTTNPSLTPTVRRPANRFGTADAWRERADVAGRGVRPRLRVR